MSESKEFRALLPSVERDECPTDYAESYWKDAYNLLLENRAGTSKPWNFAARLICELHARLAIIEEMSS